MENLDSRLLARQLSVDLDIKYASGDHFFRSLVRHLSETLKVKYAFITERVLKTETRVSILALWTGNDFAPTFEYDLKGTPCENALKGGICFHSNDVQKLYPEDKYLVEWGVESYCSIAFLDSAGTLLGHLAVMDCNPMDPKSDYVQLLKIFSARVQVEIERRDAERKLRKNERLFRSTFEQAAVGIAHANLQGEWLRINKKLCDILGYSRRELQGMNCLQITHQEDREKTRKALDGLDLGNVPMFRLEKRFLRKDGSPVWTQLTCSRVDQDSEGMSPYIVMVIEDSTLRKQMESALEKSERYHRGLFKDSIVGLALYRMTGEFADVNATFAKIFGFSVQDTLNMNYWDIIPQNLVDVEKKNLKRLQRLGSYGPYEKEFRHKGGFNVHVRISEKIVDKDDEQLIWICVEDITQSRRDKELLQLIVEGTSRAAGKDFFRSLVYNLFRAFRVRFAFVSALCQKQKSQLQILAICENGKLGDTFKYPLTRTPSEYVLEKGAVFIPKNVKNMFPENSWICKNNIESYIATTLYDSQGKAIGQLGLAHDNPMETSMPAEMILEIFAARAGIEIERKHANETLANSQKELRNLSAYLEKVREEERRSIARDIHDDLGQSLTALQVDLSLLKNQINSDQKLLRENVQSSILTVGSMIKTVKMVLVKLRPAMLDDLGLSSAIEWVVQEFQNRTGICCHFSICDEEGNLSDDYKTTLFRICQESLTNVMRHAKASEIWVDLNRNHTHIHLSIQDNGCGIRPKETSSSLSLGLLGMRERVRSFQGKVEIKGKKNQGTLVRVSLPLNEKAFTNDQSDDN